MNIRDLYVRCSQRTRRIMLASAAVAVSLMTYPAGSANAASWIFGATPDGSVCSLTYSDQRILLTFEQQRAKNEARITIVRADLPEEFTFYWQTNSGPRHRLRAFETDARGTFVFAGGRATASPGDLLLELEPVEYLKLVITPKAVYEVPMDGFTDKFAEYRKCSSDIPRPRVESKANEPSDSADTSKVEDRPVDLADSLRARATPIVASFLCEVTGSVLLGVPNIMGTEQSTTVTLNIHEDGLATYNGSRIEPQVSQKSTDGSLDFVTYDVRQLMKAAAPSASAPPVLGLDENELNAYSAFLGAGNAMLEMALGDRSRSLYVDVKNGTVVFLDHQNGKNITNERAPQCYRTK